MAKQDDFIRTALRVPPDLHKQIHAAAATSGRTFNAEIVSRLESTFQTPAPASREEVLLEGEAGATLKSLNNTMRHLEKLSERIEAHFTVAGGAEPLSLGKPAMVMRKDGAVTPFEPPEEQPKAAPPASQGPERLRRQVNRRRPT